MNEDAIIEATGLIVNKIEHLRGHPIDEIIKAAISEAKTVAVKTPLQRGTDIVDGELVSFFEDNESGITDDERFRAAVTAVAYLADPETRMKIKRELRFKASMTAKKKKLVVPSFISPRGTSYPKDFKCVHIDAMAALWKGTNHGKTGSP